MGGMEDSGGVVEEGGVVDGLVVEQVIFFSDLSF